MKIHNAIMEKEFEWIWLLGFHFSNIIIVYIHVSLVTKKGGDTSVQKRGETHVYKNVVVFISTE
jgi:hypothetical protein